MDVRAPRSADSLRRADGDVRILRHRLGFAKTFWRDERRSTSGGPNDPATRNAVFLCIGSVLHKAELGHGKIHSMEWGLFRPESALSVALAHRAASGRARPQKRNQRRYAHSLPARRPGLLRGHHLRRLMAFHRLAHLDALIAWFTEPKLLRAAVKSVCCVEKASQLIVSVFLVRWQNVPTGENRNDVILR